MSLNTAKFDANYIIYSGSTGYYAKQSTTGKVEFSGSNYNTVRNSVTGSLTGSVYNQVSNTLEVYVAGVQQTYIATGSISGSNIYSLTATITNVNATNVTGSILSGSNIYGPSALITNITTVNVTGSTLVSGSDHRGSTATITTINATNIIATNITGSTTLSGSAIYGPTATVTNIYSTNVTGSGTLSGSIIRGSVVSGSGLGIVGNAIVTGNLSGSSLSGSITMNMDGNARVAVRKNSGGTGYLRRRINVIEGANVTLTLGDDAVNEESDLTITASGGSGEPHIPCSFLVFKSGSNYFARQGRTGTLYSDTDLYTVINYGMTNWFDTYGGKIYLDLDGIHPLTTGLTFSGSNGGYTAPDKTIVMEGKGMLATVLNPADGQTGIRLANNAIVDLRNFCISMGGTGSAIYSPSKFVNSSFENIFVQYSGTNWAVHIEPMYSHFKNIAMNISGGLGGLLIENTDAGNNAGNSQFDEVSMYFTQNNGIGVKVLSTAGIMNILDFNYLQVICSPSATGTVGLQMNNGRYNIFRGLNLENLVTSIQLTNYSLGNQFIGTFMGIPSGGTFISCDSTSFSNNFGPFGYIDNLGATSTLISDANTDTTRPNIFHGIVGVDSGTFTVTKAAATIVRDIAGTAVPLNTEFIVSPDRAVITEGTSGNRGVLKLWDAGAAAWRYAYLNSGAWVIASSEPT